MKTTTDMQRCLMALNGVLAAARNMAVRNEDPQGLYRLLDAAELLPILLANPNKTEQDFLEMMKTLAEEFPEAMQLAFSKHKRGWGH